jgi:hypothetical protein
MKYLAFGTHDKKFLVARDGKLYADSAVTGSAERFRVVDLGGGAIALQAADGRFVCALNGGGGSVVTNRQAIGPWETFRLEPLVDGRFAIRTHAGNYLRGNAGQVDAGPTWKQEHESFRVETSSLVSLRSHDGKWFCVNGTSLVANQTNIEPGGRIWMIDLGGGEVALQAHAGKYLCAEGNGPKTLVVNREAIGEWETFIKSDIDPYTITLRTKGSGWLIGADSGNTYINAKQVGPWERLGFFLQANGMAEASTESYVSQAWVSDQGVTGCYHNDMALLFYSGVRYDGDNPSYWIDVLGLTPKGQDLEATLPETNLVQLADRPIGPLAAVSHKEAAYVFWPEKDGRVWFICSPDEHAWTSPTWIPGFPVYQDRQIGAVSAGGRLFVFAARSGDKSLQVAYSEDGKAWSTEVLDNWVNVGHVAATPFQDQDGSQRILFGMTSVFGNLWTGRFTVLTESAGSPLAFYDSNEHLEYRNRAAGAYLALASGSVYSGGKGLTVQLFLSGLGSGDRNVRIEWDAATNRWGASSPLNGDNTKSARTGPATAFHVYRPLDDRPIREAVRQEIWWPRVHQGWFGTCYLYLARWASDCLELKTTRTEAVPSRFRTLLGVVEGPPPYVLNGKDFDSEVSTFKFGLEQTKDLAITTSLTLGSYLKLGATGTSVLKAGLELAAEITRKYQVKQTITTEELKTISLLPAKDRVYYLYLDPTVRRREFSIADWRGVVIPGMALFIFSVTGGSLGIDFRDDVMKNFPGSPSTHDIKTWMKRLSPLPEYVDSRDDYHFSRDTTWVEGSVTDFNYKDSKSQMTLRSAQVSAKITGGSGEIFEMGFNSSFTYEFEVTGTTSQTLGFTLKYPTGTTSDHYEKVKLGTLLLRPAPGKEKDCYWIPKDQESQRPWCLAWSVKELVPKKAIVALASPGDAQSVESGETMTVPGKVESPA